MIRKTKDDSRATTSHVEIPTPEGLEYKPFQIAGIEYALKRDRILLADEMGLGKSPMSVGVANASGARKVLIICPASLKFNWRYEWQRWDTQSLTVGIVNDGKSPLPDTDVIIINYDLLSKYSESLRNRSFDLMVIDEAHYLKNGKADRTGQVFGRGKHRDGSGAIQPLKATRIMALTGTPLLNRPKELWPLCRALDSVGLGSDWMHFARRYCQLFEIERFDPAKGRKVHQGWKWDGGSHLEELQAIMRDRFMVRRLKKDVLKELPPKTRQVIVLDAKKGLTKLLESEIMEYDRYIAKHGGDLLELPAFTEMSKVRKEVALAKVPYVVEYLREVLDESQGKVVCWVHHHEVFDAVQGAFAPCATGINGRTNSADREKNVEIFQNDERIRLFVGGIRSAGFGLTLTAANIAIFAELDWTPALVTQAEDRCHRIGQRENVLIRHIVLNNSLDQRIVQKIIEKQEIADKVLDKEIK